MANWSAFTFIGTLIGIALASQCQPQHVSLTEVINISPGVRVRGINGTAYQSFVGIPYAEPPINQLRFANPKPKIFANGTFQAITNPPQCIQMNFLVPNPSVVGAEDCLFLNVYRPHKRPTKARLPVMVYIHGGAFFSGSIDPGIHGPGYFMRNGSVILVLMQYRLSTLGFLSTGDSASPGNFGLKDQVMAMQWVKDHISSFGGDPDSITIFGQSAGAASVQMHMMSPLTSGKKLFHKAIAMSGSAIAPYNYPTEDPLNLTRRHAMVLGLDQAESMTTNELVDKLRQLPADQLISSVRQLKFFDVDSLTLYRTVVEPETVQGPFLTDTPLNLLRNRDMAKVPFMTGLVQVEGAVRAAAIIVNDSLKAQLNDDIWSILPKLMDLRLEGEELENFTQQIMDKYLPGNTTTGNEDSFIKLYSDRAFEYPHYKQLDILLERDSGPIYTYHFDYRGNHSYSVLYTQTLQDFGTVHCDDLIYLFESHLLFPAGLNAEDTAMSKKLVDYYVSFAKQKNGPWQRTGRRGDKLGPYMSLKDGQLKYYDECRSVEEFWDQAGEFN